MRINAAEAQVVVRDEIDALIAQKRPGWSVTDMIEVSDESGPSYQVVIENGAERRTVMVAEDGTIAGEQG